MKAKLAVQNRRIFALLVPAAIGACRPGGTGPGGNDVQPIVVAAAGDLLNSSFEATVLRCEILFDGKMIGSTVTADPSVDCGQLVGTTSTFPGRHTVAFRIAKQSSSPNTYETVGATVGTQTSTITLGDRTKSFATGDTISYSVTLP